MEPSIPNDYSFDWINPDYTSIWAERIAKLAELEDDPILFAGIKLHYKHHIADFINCKNQATFEKTSRVQGSEEAVVD